MPSDTKTALLDCAEAAVRARGFDAFSYADLAQTVGIRKASIHYHFPTKADLSDALITRYQTMIEAKLARIDAEQPTAAGRLAALVVFYRAASHNGQSVCLCVALSGSRESLTDGVVAKMAAFRKTLVDWLARTYAAGQTDQSITGVNVPKDEARATLALLEGAHLAAHTAADISLFDGATALLTNRLTC
ncbi:TetR/AcrR family transcriptional regulator [Pseudooctadecabacter jejudonensis]|uniref:HTH-type transcriptional repressor NemR n=1 Tax=Pseudooctadecabacter jejudonensis TaxID=1391910 RepID=A0A1Y5SMW3_9RHOB|nr:TetR/AcrR family transcriptional regulator [Pseudooctadecabacter jejudonensis]SLN44409.1 HTH-type transcriptional repressor NemR [Pseudooctadecabacter jejudonensis]